MLGFDCLTYRFYEGIAKSLLQNWRIAAIFSLDIFQKNGIPIRIDSVLTLRSIIDTMQEERFNPIMQELQGLSDEELEIYLTAIKQAVLFQLQMFPHLDPLPPYDAMLHAFLIYSRISKLKPGFKSLLEIGPGCGYNSFFLKNHQTLQDYSIIEACESFYLLQNHVNQFCFSDKFLQNAPIDIVYNSPQLNKKFGQSDITFTHLDDHSLKTSVQTKIVNHYPWWQLGELYSNDKQYDLVMSNSNLMEFTNGCLLYYLDLINKKMSDDGYFVVVGAGYYDSQAKMDNLSNLLYDAGFAPMFITNGYVDEYDTQAVLDCINGEDVVIFAPYSEKIQSFLKMFQQYFENKKICVVDDYVEFDSLNPNITFVKSSEVSTIALPKTAFVSTFTEELANKFNTLFTNNDVNVCNVDNLLLQRHTLCMYNAVFINNRNPLYGKYNRIDYLRRDVFIAEEFSLQSHYFGKSESCNKYSKEDIRKIIECFFGEQIINVL